ncbi:peptidase M20 [Anoxybacter fermentans]|uniref:Peptidase M20 n=1 Tax=Anoxybacter fermentans TaxID=1323375 RepID=A0A3S9SYQ9_9FIRM|nr:M20/M25/M40 family metallo-hydrolase [Anoxybacter fermentans]AZR73439.1 peptidase M20 [Anoxybacter fermentans]
MIKKKRLVDLFMELVTIDSETKKERKMADQLKTELENLGLEVHEDNAGENIGGNAGNVIGVLKGKVDTPSLLLCAHMDRVSPGKGIEPVLKDGVITSKGDTVLAADDIAGVAAILEALWVIKENNLEHGEIKVLFTVAEEGGLHGVKNVNPEEIRADYGFCYDSSGDVGTIVVQGPAQYRFEAIVKGKAAHAGINPSAGINAIKVASLAISEMKLGQIDEETTANIGVIKGGQATNIVPDRVELLGEARSRNRKKLEAQVAHMRDILERAAAKFGAEVEINTQLMYPSFFFSEEDPVVIIAKEAAKSIGIETNLVPSGGGSDANILNGYGIPTINLGIGMEKVHSTEEFITVENLVKAAEYTVAIIQMVTK